MPSSPSESIPYLIEFIRKNNPSLASVLDVGVGFGKDGFLLREYFDVKKDKLYAPKDWKLQITGVEIFPIYISELQKLVYNTLYKDDIFKVLPTLGNFDLAILAEVIEHFPKEKGYTLLEELFKHVESIVITTPLGFKEHKAHDNNPHEEHLSGWSIDDFREYTIVEKAIVKRIFKNEEILVVYIRK